MRSGGDPVLTADDNNGFLLDLDAPQLIGNQPIRITSVPQLLDSDSDLWVMSFEFLSLGCALTPTPPRSSLP